MGNQAAATEFDRVISLFKELEIVYFVTETKDKDGGLRSIFIHYKDKLGRTKNPAQVIWEFNKSGRFVGELLNGVLVGRKFDDILPGISEPLEENANI
jgi:hypothetical protein